jgi:hypothetical protein
VSDSLGNPLTQQGGEASAPQKGVVHLGSAVAVEVREQRFHPLRGTCSVLVEPKERQGLCRDHGWRIGVFDRFEHCPTPLSPQLEPTCSRDADLADPHFGVLAKVENEGVALQRCGSGGRFRSSETCGSHPLPLVEVCADSFIVLLELPRTVRGVGHGDRSADLAPARIS